MTIDLSSIQKDPEIRPPLLLLYGTPGIGKTEFAINAPAPIMVQTEKGLGHRNCERFPLAEKYTDVLQAMSALLNDEHEYRTAVLDSVSSLEPLIWKCVAELAGKDHIEDLGYGSGYVKALDFWQQIMDLAVALRDERQMCVILIGHEVAERFDNPQTESYTRYVPQLHKKAASLFWKQCDAVLFAGYRANVRKEDQGFGGTRTRAIGNGDRILYTEERPSHLAKNRWGLPAELPLSWDAFIEAYRASKPE